MLKGLQLSSDSAGGAQGIVSTMFPERLVQVQLRRCNIKLMDPPKAGPVTG